MSERDRDGRTASHLAAFEGNIEMLVTLVAGGANMNAADDRGLTPLHLAAQQRNSDAVRVLLEAGCFVDPVDFYGNTPLWTAVFNSEGEGDIIRLLRDGGADPGHKNKNGKSPVDLARTIDNVNVRQHFTDL